MQVRGAPDGRGAVAQGMLACGCQRTGQCMMAGTWPIPAASACRCREACVGRNACCKGAAGVAAPHDAIPTSEHRQLKSAGTANGARRCRCRRTHAAAPAASDIGSLPSRPTDAASQSSAVARRRTLPATHPLIPFSCVRLPLMLASALCEHALGVWNRMRVVVLMLAAGVPLASAFAPPAGLTIAGGKLTAPAALSARRPVRLTELKASFTGLADPKYPLAPTVTGGPLDESDYTVPEWRKKVDLKAWGAEIRAVEKKYRDAESEEDVKHMKKMLSWTYVLYAIGLATAGIATGLPFGVNPISALCLSTAICMRWTMIGHHVCHGGYNKLVGIGNRWHRSTFARGPVARFMDWCDWMLPEAWDVEHNALHHYELGEGSDPDLLERNAHNVRIATRPKVGLLLRTPLPCVSSRVCASCLSLWPVPLACRVVVPKLSLAVALCNQVVKYMEMLALAVMWKWFYYAPNTLKEMYDRQIALAAKKGDTSIVQPFDMPTVRKMWGVPH